MRIVVPDLLSIVTRYYESALALRDGDQSASREHEEAVRDLFEQMVLCEDFGTSRQRPLVRWVEGLIRGGPQHTGHMHRWMYDRFTLGALLSDAGFRSVQVCTPTESRVDRWVSFNLDTNDDGTAYKPGSLILEAIKD